MTHLELTRLGGTWFARPSCGRPAELGGEVVDRRVTAEGEHVVEVATTAVNQRGQDVMPGSAVVALPSRDETRSPVARRARR